MEDPLTKLFTGLFLIQGSSCRRTCEYFGITRSELNRWLTNGVPLEQKNRVEEWAGKKESAYSSGEASSAEQNRDITAYVTIGKQSHSDTIQDIFMQFDREEREQEIRNEDERRNQQINKLLHTYQLELFSLLSVQPTDMASLMDLVKQIQPKLLRLTIDFPLIQDLIVGIDADSGKNGILLVEKERSNFDEIFKILELSPSLVHVTSTAPAFKGSTWSGFESSNPSRHVFESEITIDHAREAARIWWRDLKEDRPGVQMITVDHRRSKRTFLREEYCIAVYVRQKGFLEFGEKPLPKFVVLPEIGVTVPIDVRTGIPVPFTGQHQCQWETKVSLASGSSIGLLDYHNGAGTLGFFAKHRSTNQFGFVTCAHVALSFDKIHSVPMCYPAKRDCLENEKQNLLQDTNATPVIVPSIDAAFVPIAFKPSNTLSFAVTDFRCWRDVGFTPVLNGQSISYQRINSRVFKVGRTTGLTIGRVWTPPTDIPFMQITFTHDRDSSLILRRYEDYLRGEPMSTFYKPYIIHDVGSIQCEPSFEIFAQPGDSGSLVCTIQEEHAVPIGLLFGGLLNSFEYFFYVPIDRVLNGLDVSFI